MFNRLLGLGEPDEAKIAQFKEELASKLDVYERILSKQPYIAGQVSLVFYCFISNNSCFEI
jgi:glutathione S-transferase